MGKKDDNPYHIEKLKGEKNWESYHIDLKSILIKEGLWKWASGRAKRPSYPPKPVPSEDGTAVTAAQHDHHKKEVEEWSKEVDKFDEGHEEAMAVIHLTTMPEPREHVKGYTNSEHAMAKLLKQYGTSNLATVDTSFQEICRSNMEDFPGLFEYAEHIQRHHNKILQAGKDLYPWQLSSAFRMGLPSHLGPYVFPLVNAAKAADKELSIDDMVDALAEEQRRSNYAEEKTEAARAIKNSRNRNYGNNGRKDRGQGPCNGCNSPYHDQPHCPYEFPTQRPPNWKPYELKLHLAKDWKKSDGFVQANANVKNDKKTVKKVNSHSSIASKASSTTSSSSSHATRSRMIKIKQEQKHASVKRAGKANKDPDFYLDTAADAHVCYDKSRFNYIKPPRQPKSIEVVTGDLASVEGVGSITFDLDIDGRKAINTISNVEYVPDSDYNLIATGLLCRGGYKAKHDDQGYTVTDRTTKEIFMTGSLQPISSKGNSYILNQWGIKIKAKARKARISWTQWHRRLGHLNMKYVKKLAAMGLIDATNDPTENCESCAMGKMHRTLNRHPVRAERRATRKGQRIHTDLAGGGNIIRTPRGKRYVVIFIDDYTDYTWAYLIRHKKEFQRVLKEFILMLKAEHHDVESIRCDNAGENINKDTDALLKEHGIKWEPTVADNPHQNGVAERAFRTIFNRVRACLYDSKLPKYLWGEACHTVVYLKNRSPCSLLDSKTPYEAWNDRQPILTHLHPFGTHCVAYKEKAKKLDDHGIKCRLLGYEASNQYVLWDIKRRCTMRAVHVSFDEAKPIEIKEDDGHNDDLDYATLNFNRPGRNNESETTQQVIESSNDTENVTWGGQQSPPASDSIINAEEEHHLNPEEDTDNVEEDVPPRRSIRTRNEQSYARIQNPWNRRLGGEGNMNTGSTRHIRLDSGNPIKARGFAARIRKTKSTNTYTIPKNFSDVLLHPDKDKFLEAMRVEVNHHKDKKTWTTMLPDPGTKVIDGRWVYAIKEDAEGNIVRWKARWVAKGFLQKYGVDFFETYSGVVKTMIWQLILALVAKYDYEAHHVDIVTAFLESDLKERVFVRQPIGFEEKGDANLACLLLKALYGLKQSPRAWYDILKDFMLEMGFIRLMSDYSVFVHHNGMIVAIYVDDLLVCGPREDNIIDFKEKLAERFRITDLGSVSCYLGVKIMRDRAKRIIHLSQTAYIKQLVDECGLSECKPIDTPMQQVPLQPNVHNGMEYHATNEEIKAYAHILGKLQWLATNTRQDIAFATNKLSQFMTNPTPTHMQAIKRVVRYLAGTAELGKQYGPGESHAHAGLYGYTDSAHGDDEETRRSQSGYLFKLWNGVISYASKRQDTVATSSTEAEYVGQCNASKEAYFLKQVMTELGEPVDGAVPILADNQSAIALATNPGNHRRTKHIPIQQHYVRELVEQGQVEFSYVSTNDMAADGLTKPLRPDLFRKFVRMLGLVPAPPGCK